MSLLRPVTDEHAAAIAPSKSFGRERVPSEFAAEIEELVKLYRDTPEGEETAWQRIDATQTRPLDHIVKELNKGGRHYNADHPDDMVSLQVRPRDDHPKLKPFVAVRVTKFVPRPRKNEEGTPDAPVTTTGVQSDTK